MNSDEIIITEDKLLSKKILTHGSPDTQPSNGQEVEGTNK